MGSVTLVIRITGGRGARALFDPVGKVNRKCEKVGLSRATAVKKVGK
jgi:hypothetical protein